MMAYTREDAAEDMAEQDALEHHRERRQREREAKMDEAMRRREEEFERHLQDLFPQRDDADLGEFTVYASKLMERAKAHKHSKPRCVILSGLATMQNYSAFVGRDGDTMRTVLDGITEPATHPDWGPRGKPASTYSHKVRMVRDELCEDIEEDVGDGDFILGVRARPVGIAYCVLHGYLRVEKLVECWKTDGRGPRTTTNPWALRSADPLEDYAGFRFTTPTTWACLDLLQDRRTDIEGRYGEKKPHEIAAAFTASYNQDAAEAFRFLDDDHRQHLIEEVLLQADIGSNRAAFNNLVGHVGAKRSLGDRIAAMVEFYASGNPLGPDDDGGVDVPETERRAKATVEELVCRFTWVIVRRLMDRRMAVSAPEALMTAQDDDDLSLSVLLEHLRGLPEVIDFQVQYQMQNDEHGRADLTIEATTLEPFPPDEEPF